MPPSPSSTSGRGADVAGRREDASADPDPPDDASWRLEVGRFRATHPARVFPLEVHLGVPAGARVSLQVPWPVDAAYDVGLRLDLALALVERWRGDHPGADGSLCGWVSRAGDPELHDEDFAWHAALDRAAGAHGLRMAVVRVVTKHGWLDVRSGEQRRWVRLRLAAHHLGER